MRTMSFERVGLLAILALAACGDAGDDPANLAERTLAQEDLAATEETPSAPELAGDPAEVYVRKVVLTGKGCYPWSGFVQKRGNQHYIRLSDYRFLFDFTRMSESFDCIAHIDLHVPAGRTVAVSKWKFAGTAQVDPHAMVDFSAGLGWQGLDEAAPVQKRFASGVKEVFEATGAVGVRPCDGTSRQLELDLNAKLNRAADASAGHTSLQSIDLVLYLDDPVCPAPSP